MLRIEHPIINTGEGSRRMVLRIPSIIVDTQDRGAKWRIEKEGTVVKRL